MADDTRDLVIALRQDVKHVTETLENHIKDTKSGRQEIKDDIDALKIKQQEYHDLIQQVKGAGVLAGLLRPAVVSAATFLSGVSGLKWMGLLR